MKTKFYIGLDVHKKQTTYAVKDINGVTIDKGSCATQFEDLHKLLSKYLMHAAVIMEACTNYYHLYKKMKEAQIDVHVANVIQLRKVIGKNDILDAERLADMYRLNALPESYIPDEKIQNLRILVNVYHNEVATGVRVSNQITACLDRNGIILSVADPFSKKGLIFIDDYLERNENYALKKLIESYRSSEQRQSEILSGITEYLKSNFLEEYDLLKKVRGVGEIIVGYLIAEICPIERFANKKKLRRYAGVIPIKEQSDKKTYATYLPKNSSRKLLRYALVLAANCAVRCKDSSRLRIYYNKKKKGSTHSHAIMCVTSSICDIIYAVLKTKQPYPE